MTYKTLKNKMLLRMRYFYSILKKIIYRYVFTFEKPDLSVEEWRDLHQVYEKDGWGDCKDGHVKGEESKQHVYARLMKFSLPYEANNRSILDIGGGPISMLLKTKNFSRATVADPCNYPKWVIDRYSDKNIEFIQDMAEEFLAQEKYDEVWCYNVLQHTHDPARILENMKKNSKDIIRIFEWVYAPPTIGHPQFITREMIENVFDRDGWRWVNFEEDYLNEDGCVGRAVFGVAKKI